MTYHNPEIKKLWEIMGILNKEGYYQKCPSLICVIGGSIFIKEKEFIYEEKIRAKKQKRNSRRKLRKRIK